MYSQIYSCDSYKYTGAGKGLRDWSLITERGGHKTGGGGQTTVSPMKRGVRKSFSHAEGWHTMFWGRFYMEA